MSTIEDPSTDAEFTNKKYVDATIVSSHIDSSTNKLNVFDFVMDDPNLWEAEY